VQVTIPNEILTQSRRSRFSLDNPEIHSCYWKSTLESSLINRYGTRRRRMRQVVGRAMTNNRGMTVPESKTTPTASNHRNGSEGRKHLGAHLPAENRSGRRVNQHTWRWSGMHTRRKAGERTQQLEMISAPSTGRMSSVPTSAPTCRMISATARAPER
jgi:hypothetical protein